MRDGPRSSRLNPARNRSLPWTSAQQIQAGGQHFRADQELPQHLNRWQAQKDGSGYSWTEQSTSIWSPHPSQVDASIMKAALSLLALSSALAAESVRSHCSCAWHEEPALDMHGCPANSFAALTTSVVRSEGLTYPTVIGCGRDQCGSFWTQGAKLRPLLNGSRRRGCCGSKSVAMLRKL